MLREKVLDLGPNTLDEALGAAQWYESNQKVLSKGSAHVLFNILGDGREFYFTSGDSRTSRMGSAAISTTGRNLREVEEHSLEGKVGMKL